MNRTYQGNPIIIVQGGAWGSEAKGAIAAFLCQERRVDYAIRTGTVNAGHTVYFNGLPQVFQQLPTGWVNPATKLVLGPGAYIHPHILAREIALISDLTGQDVRRRLYIDRRCGLHLPEHTDRAQVANRHHKMGATGKGCSEAVVSKIRGRGTDEGRTFADWMKRDYLSTRTTWTHWEKLINLELCDTVQLLNSAWDDGAQLLIEGTQGTLLDLHTGPYPYTTHKQTACGNWMAEAGLSPSLPTEVILVCRTFPIRVAGNSGPMPGETSWIELAQTINQRLAKFGKPQLVRPDSLTQFIHACQEVARDYFSSHHGGTTITGPRAHWIDRWSQPEREAHQEYVSELHARALRLLPGPVVEDLRHLFELTTVTKKLRRIARLDFGTLREAVVLNRPASIALTFLNHVFPEMWGKTEADLQITGEWGLDVRHYLSDIEAASGVPVNYVSLGPESKHVIRVKDESAQYKLVLDHSVVSPT